MRIVSRNGASLSTLWLPRVFVSSTCQDLEPYREEVEIGLARTGRYRYVGAENFGSRPSPPKEECISQVVSSNVYVGIFGDRYGSIPKGEETSMTEIEYRKAKEIGLPCLIYCKKETSESIESHEDPPKAKKLKELKEELGRDYLISRFDSPSDLAMKIVADLPKLELHLAIENTNNWYRSTLRNNHIKGKVIHRTEADLIVSKLLSSDARHDVLLAGVGGVGKSGIILQVLKALDEQQCPFLAFRVDLPSPSITEFGARFDLKEFPVRLVRTFAEAAQGQKCVLILDQLDSIGLAPIGTSELSHCVDEVMKQAQACPNMRLLAACKKFDLENDERLVDLFASHPVTDTVVVEPLSEEIVREIMGWGANVNLSSAQLRLWSLPLHLKLTEDFEAPLDPMHFSTPTHLFDRLWKHENEALRKYSCSDDKFVAVIEAIIDYMIKRQVLFVPVEELELHRHCADAMTSENILVSDGTYLLSFHESFLSYAFARRHFGDGSKLVSYLKHAGQLIFQRSLVQGLLQYGREKRFYDYLITVETLLNDPDVEFHLKQAVLATLASLENPREEEWKPLARIIDDDVNDRLSEAIWRTILFRSVNWFKMLDSNGVIEQWLDSSDDNLLDKVILLLCEMQPLQSQRVAELLTPYVGISEGWHQRLKHVVSYADLGIERTFFELFLKIIDDGALDEDIKKAKGDFWDFLYGLPESRADWTCEAIGRFLSRSLMVSVRAGQLNPFDYSTGLLRNAQGTGGILLQSLPKCAEQSPIKFIFEYLPFMLAVMYGTTDPEGEAPLRDRVWRLRHYSGGLSVKDVLLRAMEMAFRRMASDDPKQLADLVGALEQYDYDTLNYLIIRGYAANGQAFANESVDYLCDKPARMEAGYVGGHQWAARELLEAVTPYCSEDKLARLERYFTDVLF